MHKIYSQIKGFEFYKFISSGKRENRYCYFSNLTLGLNKNIYIQDGEALMYDDGGGYGDGYCYNIESFENADPFYYFTQELYTLCFFGAREDVS